MKRMSSNPVQVSLRVVSKSAGVERAQRMAVYIKVLLSEKVG
jgi:hypothetical protein